MLLLDQEPEASIGGQAWWSFGGLFLVDSPEQRRMGLKIQVNSLGKIGWVQLALIERKMKIFWGKKCAEAYVDFASGEKRDWLYKRVLQTDLSGRVLDTAGNPVPG